MTRIKQHGDIAGVKLARIIHDHPRESVLFIRANPRHGQSLGEYVILLVVVTLTFLGIHYYARRGIQAFIKTAADQLRPDGPFTQGEPMQLDAMGYEVGQNLKDRTALQSGAVINRLEGAAGVSGKTADVSTPLGGEQITAFVEASSASGNLDDKGVSSYALIVADDGRRPGADVQ